ncbi:hypothetical protein COY65_01630 [Candidatus Jorgensenbacteria bacterium CG_4_10_14_0_8_um_filter_39_13]|uniref:Uncharacterized protein n=2 Tax=Candidatus Joergenseniibacteriota TaxID=1752739 RepID=A0A2M7RH46_9BACT|nr:MAG: hypothetical protein COV54_01995 [Candidatus Jorgensenbacteria bacterium CG11_big_fil_rev_8_21_14_0_20_38_23]PIV13417.1 MAG: hypothetical protein COS46_00460 [Candidatus Jorgensenbacteria bacterium CG03_land_8_20_14_0_80_38_39]PIW97643.1 MAG: hypothetical protein COZ81_01575 [Candidatus Jorgensenbacteria bacterium CG_4_8_14_3_um_filter_38_10]PIY96070.1 MAG: hypothetical protein COY65_01630 [Candidatus Jorgensenbacteria bacterium CG_4_10_14_0_8_um_filter_39_13]PJA95206.1 MAG: hypothetica
MRKSLVQGYLAQLRERKKESRVYTAYQAAGLALAEILEDEKHKSLYMKLAKNYNSTELITLAKNVASRKSIKNKGAYFMKVLNKTYPNILKKIKNGKA